MIPRSQRWVFDPPIKEQRVLGGARCAVTALRWPSRGATTSMSSAKLRDPGVDDSRDEPWSLSPAL